MLVACTFDGAGVATGSALGGDSGDSTVGQDAADGDTSADDGIADAAQDTAPTSAADDDDSDDEAASDTTGVAVDDTAGDESSDDTTSDGGSEDTGQALCLDSTWWGPLWERRRELVLDNEDVEETLVDFPVLVRLNSARVDYSLTKDDGTDVRFVLADGFTVLPHEIESWDEAGDSFVWIKLPSLPEDGNATPLLHMYYGNDAALDASLPAQVWSNGYRSVHHMGQLTDSTGLGHDAAAIGGVTEVQGAVGRASAFNGLDGHAVLPAEQDYDFGGGMTVEALVRVDGFSVNWQALVTKGDSAWRLHRYEGENTVAFSNNTTLGSDSMSAGVNMLDAAYHSVAMSLGGDNKRVFVDGVLIDSDLYLLNISGNDEPVMFGENSQATGRFFHGVMDEVRISGSGRSIEWLQTSHRAQRDLGLVLYGVEESCPT